MPEEYESYYKTSFENLPFLAFILDRKGNVINSNKFAQKTLGITENEANGKHFSKIVKITNKKHLLRAFVEFRKNLSGKVTEKSIYDVITPDGKQHTVELIGIPLMRDGKVEMVLDVGEEITERLATENRLKKKMEELEAFKQMSIGRENRMIELKKKIELLEK
ncbi:MAG: PAS domain S-box protein [Candidatus Aenigmarchaeota archaeon]|nr:PAS domain S-box protein [Candidatus Aenigmarchaeota archaeon]